MPIKRQVGLLSAVIITLSGVAAAQAEAPAPDPTAWHGSAAAGVTLTRGNSSTLLATMSAATGKKWDQNEVSLGADGAYGKSKINGVSSETANSLHGFAQYNRLFTERLYGFIRADGLHDEIADLAYRLTLAPGLGYYLIKEKKTDLSVEFGPGFVKEKRGGKDKGFVVLRVAEKLRHEISDRARIWQSVEFLPQVDRFSNYVINAEIGIESDLTADKKMTLRAFLQDTYNHEPAAGRQKNDAKLVTAIAYKF